MSRLVRAALLMVLLVAPAVQAETLEIGAPVVMRMAAVAETPEGLVGALATVTIRTAEGGAGHVFLDTFPLTEVDMQGSARLAARVAAQVAGKSLREHDFFFVIRSGSTQVGGPSAGATLTVGSIAALNGWAVRDDVVMTGTIQPDGSIGPVGGIPEKAQAAAGAGATEFLYPASQEVVLSGAPPRRVNMSAYCSELLRITCTPVAHVREAVGRMTDHEIVPPAPVGDARSDLFRRALAPSGERLVGVAQARVEEAREAIAQVRDRQPSTVLQQRLAAAEEKLAAAREALEGEEPYNAASLSLQTSIEAHTLRHLARYLTEGPGMMAGAIEEAREAIASARRDVDAAQVRDAARFESVGAAQERLLEAEEHLRQAEAGVAGAGGEAHVAGLEFAALAAERAATASWWLDLGEAVPAGGAVDPAAVRETAADALRASEEILAYAQAVLARMGSGAQLQAAATTLARAQAAMERDYHAGAVLLAMRAEVQASAALETAGQVSELSEARLESKRVEAARAIEAARGRGVEPLLGQTLYEHALAQEAPLERVVHLDLARVVANLAGLPGTLQPLAPPETRFQGLPRVTVPVAWMVAAFAVGLALGVGTGLTALMPEDEEKVGKKEARREEPETLPLAPSSATGDGPAP